MSESPINLTKARLTKANSSKVTLPKVTLPKVSVLMLVYQHAEYVAQAIDSVLSQRCDFDFELLIIDDASSDASGQICAQKAQQYSHQIRFIQNQQNKGMHASFEKIWNASQGEHIAFCEGDDYWTDTSKLAQQVAHLEANQSLNLIGAVTTIISQDQHGDWQQQGTVQPPVRKEVYSFSDLIVHYNFHFSSVVLRKSTVQFPDWFNTVYCVDRPIYLLATQSGDAGFIDKSMSCYRLHDQGNWSSLDHKKKAQQSQHLFNTMAAFFPKDFRLKFKRTLVGVTISYIDKERHANRLESAKIILSGMISNMSYLDRLRLLPSYLATLISVWRQ